MRRLVLFFLVAACSDPSPEVGGGGGGPPTVSVVNYPLQYFAERIGGGVVEVKFNAPRDIDPALWRPGDAEIALFQSADLILLNGAGYAGWTEHASLPRSRCVDTAASFRDRYMKEDAKTTHSHGPGGEHQHGGVAFTTWLDLDQAARQARAIRDAFVRRWPGHESVFEAGWTALEKDLAEIDRRFAAAVPDIPLVASHPVYQYWARRYEARLKSVHFEPGEMPDAALWRGLQVILEKHPARWMIWEAKPLPATLKKLGSLGVSSVVVDPCAHRPPNGDFLTVMRANAANLESAFGR